MALKRVNGIRFGELHSYYDLGMWLSERPDYGAPEPKTNLVEVPGMDGILDMTEANSGEVKFSNRIITLTFASMVPVGEQEQFKAKIRNALHGAYIEQIIPDEDPDWYYSGRATVDFSEIKSWKLKCIITVDAEPYARKISETEINLLSGAAEAQDIVIRSKDVAKLSWNTDLRFGTKTFPAGIGLAGLGDVWTLKFPASSGTLRATKKIQIFDAEGHTYEISNIQSEAIARREISLDMAAITSAGIVPSKVYRIVVYGVGRCTLHITKLGLRVRAWNERKSVVPIIDWKTNNNPGGEEHLSELEIIVNGEERTINNKQSEYEDIVLRQGWNDILIPLDYMQFNTVSLNMIYREGRL